ncbi:hypothetical protein EV175_007112, partial [Coemansia sp. RSA 1933]
TGVPINDTPVPGCIAQTDAGHKGHVAWVTKVTSSSVTVEEYNYVYHHKYSTRTLPRSTFKYIHLKLLQDQQPGPAGSSKPKETLANAPPLTKECLKTTDDLNDRALETIAHLVDSVRKIRAATDEVIDARTRIDETLEEAKELIQETDTN